MADEAITSIVGSFVDPIVEPVKYLFNLGGNMRNLQETAGDLKVTKNEVERKIKRAREERDDQEPTERVLKWQKGVQTAENEVAEIEGDHNRLKMCFGGCPLNCWSGYRVSKRAANRLAELKELLDEGGEMGAVTETIIPAHRPMLDSTLHLPATEILLEDAIKYLEDETVGMIGIWGMGGVGKTTLLKRINNHPQVESAGYSYVIWAVVSQEFNPERLQKDIAKRVGLKFEEEQNATTESQAQSLRHFLKNKKLLLLLDDIWQAFDLENLGIPNLGCSDNKVPQSKVIFTTRFVDVCEGMTAFPHQGRHMEKIEVGRLKPEEAWDLFFANTGETVQKIIKSDGSVRERAQIVANKCAGLPLALVVIARAMSGKQTWHEWEDAINSMKDLRYLPKLWVEGTDPLYPVLKFSYDRLMNDQMKKCFLCCALWPEDHDIPKDGLIRRWLGMGLIADFSSINEAISKGHSIIEGLKGAAMLEETVLHETYDDEYFTICVKLHDIIRGMALWIASDCGENRNKWIVGTGIKTSTIKAQEAEIVSLMYSEVDNLSQFPNCPNLTALMLVEADFNVDVDVDGFVKNIPALTYLDLSSIVRSIDLVRNRLVEKLSNVLIGLQCLDLSNIWGLSLPKELVNLTKLKYLFIRNSVIESMPHGLISGLQKLEILDLSYSVYLRWEEEGEASVAELGRKNAAGGLKAVGIDLTPSLLQRLSTNHPHVPLWRLQIYDDRKRLQTQLRLFKSLFPGDIFPRSLQSLELLDFENVEEMFIAGCEDRLDNLERLIFNIFPKLRKISWEGGVVPRVLFQNLSHLDLCGFQKLEDVSWIAQLPGLEVLIIQLCEVLEQVIGGAEDDDGKGEIQGQDPIETKAEATATENRVEILPNLKFLKLEDLHSLRYFCSPQITFPSLQHVEIRRCPQLDLSFLKETKAKVVKGSLWSESDDSELDGEDVMESDDFEGTHDQPQSPSP